MSEIYYPSHAEIEAIQGPRIAEISERTNYAKFAAPSQPSIRYLDIVGDEGFQSKSESTRNGYRFASPNLLDETVQLLCDIRDHESDGLKRRYDRLKWGIEKGNKRLKELTNAGYVIVTKVPCSSPKGGRARLVASITVTGREFLDALNNQNNE